MMRYDAVAPVGARSVYQNDQNGPVAQVAGVGPAGRLDGIAPVVGSTAPYVGRGKCIENGDTCEGPKAKGTDYCAGHLRSQGLIK